MFIFLGYVYSLFFIFFFVGEFGDKWIVYCGSYGEICRGNREEFFIFDIFWKLKMISKEYIGWIYICYIWYF